MPREDEITVPGPMDFCVCDYGGLDSVFVALYLSEKYRGRVHLLTMDHGHPGLLFRQQASRRVADLRRLMGQERVLHTFSDTRGLARDLLGGKLVSEMVLYRSHLIWCLGCALCLDVAAIRYCLANSVPFVKSCSPPGGDPCAATSLPVAASERKRIYHSYGVVFSTPLADLGWGRPEELDYLKRRGISIGGPFKRAGEQPVCLPGVTHAGRIGASFYTLHTRDQIQRYIRDKEPWMRRKIEEPLRAGGRDVDDLIRRLRDQTAYLLPEGVSGRLAGA